MTNVIFVNKYFHKEHILIVGKLGDGKLISSKIRSKGVKMIVTGYPVVEDPTNLYYIPVLINNRDRDKVEEALTEYTKVLKCSGRYDEYESFHNCVSMAVNTLRKKYNSKNLIKRGIDTITSFFSVVKDTITHNLRFCVKTVSV